MIASPSSFTTHSPNTSDSAVAATTPSASPAHALSVQ